MDDEEITEFTVVMTRKTTTTEKATVQVRLPTRDLDFVTKYAEIMSKGSNAYRQHGVNPMYRSHGDDEVSIAVDVSFTPLPDEPVPAARRFEKTDADVTLVSATVKTDFTL